MILPEMVARFIERARVPADEAATCVRLRQRAWLRMGQDKPWRSIQAQQEIRIQQPGFAWRAVRKVLGLPLMNITDAYLNGEGYLEVRLLGFIPVANARGSELDRSELMRYLAELPWAPDAMQHNATLRWRGICPRCVEVSADSRSGAASVRLLFNQAGDISEIQADERASREGGQMILRPWIGRFAEYGLLGGRRIPTTAEVGYVYDDGYASYWRGQVTDYSLEGGKRPITPTG